MKKRQLAICILVLFLVFAGAMPVLAAVLDDSTIEWYEVNISDALIGYENKYAISIDKEKEMMIVTTTANLVGDISYQLKRWGINMNQVKVVEAAIPKPKDIPADDNMTIVTGAVNVRSGPNTSFKKLGKLKKGQGVSVLDVNKDWACIEYGKGFGYVSLGYLKLYHKKEDYPSIGGVATAAINIRSGPSTKHDVVGQFEKGQYVTVVSVVKKWAEVNYGFMNSKTGYVSLNYLWFNIKGS